MFYCGATHASEWITSTLLMKFLENLCVCYSKNLALYGYSIRQLLHNSTLYILPMLNPDGVNLVNDKLNFNSKEYSYARYISKKFPDIPFPSGWKANINGVDLNLQFPAEWESARKIKYSQGYYSPSPKNYVGVQPLTEPEAQALYKFTLAHKFRMILTYHTQGKEIYWQFKNYAPKDAYNIGLKFSQSSGYTLTTVPYESSFAGFKDWFLQEFKRPGFTIEAGFGESPLPLSQFNSIYNDNIGILVLASVL